MILNVFYFFFYPFSSFLFLMKAFVTCTYNKTWHRTTYNPHTHTHLHTHKLEQEVLFPFIALFFSFFSYIFLCQPNIRRVCQCIEKRKKNTLCLGERKKRSAMWKIENCSTYLWKRIDANRHVIAWHNILSCIGSLKNIFLSLLYLSRKLLLFVVQWKRNEWKIPLVKIRRMQK